jgi:NifU-like protein involved in Fe-S cluster formation
MPEDKSFYRTFVENMMNNGYSLKAMLLLINNVNMGQLENPDIESKYVSECGDMLIIRMKLDNTTIAMAKFEYIGCMGLQISASALTELITGLSIEQAEAMRFDDILGYLESMPQGKYECMELALNTLWSGINKYKEKAQNNYLLK